MVRLGQFSQTYAKEYQSEKVHSLVDWSTSQPCCGHENGLAFLLPQITQAHDPPGRLLKRRIGARYLCEQRFGQFSFREPAHDHKRLHQGIGESVPNVELTLTDEQYAKLAR